MQIERDEETIEVFNNNSLPVLCVDSLNMGWREVDNMHLIRLFTSMPNGLAEQARLMVSHATLKGMLDSLCDHCEYYPEKPKTKPSKKRTSKKSSK